MTLVGGWQARSYDVVVVGGGINGAAIARDAALRGLSVLLVEKADFACGTSSKSSKLIHGGLRYLEHYEFSLVRESLRERSLLAHSVPHLVKPLPFIFPLLPGDRPMWFVGLGLWLYDWLASDGQTFGRHRRLRPAEVNALLPGVRADVVGGFEYCDAQMDDARLVLENVIAAERRGAVAVNYCEFRGVVLEEGRVVAVNLSHAEREFAVSAKCVIQATGVWTRDWDGSGTTPKIGPSKGTHIVLPSMGLKHAVTLPVPDSERIFFVIPWHGFTLVGTTDDAYAGSPDDVAATRDEVDHLLSCVAHYFPRSAPTFSDVVAAFAGLRPLVSQAGDTARASREHEIHVAPTGVLTIVGGKYTTYRAIAEEVVDRIPGVTGKCSTKTVTFADDFSIPHPELAAFAAGPGERLSPGWLAVLDSRYGPRAPEVRGCVEATPDGGRPIGVDHANGASYLKGEVDYAVLVEHCHTLDDWFCRRTLLQWTLRDGGASLAPVVAERMANLLGWPAADVERKVAEYQARVAKPAWASSALEAP